MNRRTCFYLTVIISVLYASCSVSKKGTDKEPIVIREQGSFAVGGKVITNPGTFDPYNPAPGGQTFRGDHVYVYYQIPVNSRKFPLVMI